MSGLCKSHEPPQWEVRIDILARRSFGSAFEACLNLFVGFEANQAVMVPLAEIYAPIGGFDVSRVDDARQYIGDLLVADFTIRKVFREFRLALKKTLHFDLRFEATASIAFQRFLQNGGVRFVPHQQLAVAVHPLVAVTNRCLKHPVAILSPRTHAIYGLFTSLALQWGVDDRCGTGSVQTKANAMAHTAISENPKVHTLNGLQHLGRAMIELAIGASQDVRKPAIGQTSCLLAMSKRMAALSNS